jgi:ribose-phosphate pyrophosphokinase
MSYHLPNTKYTMVRNIVILGGNSHPQLIQTVSDILGVPQCNRLLNKFSVGESRLEIQDSVRGKDVYIIQSGGGKVNDNFIDLCIMISACKTGSAKRVTAVLPLFPYSRQPDVPYNKAGAPLSRAPTDVNRSDFTFESRPATPSPSQPQSQGLANGLDGLHKKLGKTSIDQQNGTSYTNGIAGPRRSDTVDSQSMNGRDRGSSQSSQTPTSTPSFTTHDYANAGHFNNSFFQAKPGYKQWVAQAGTLVADLLTCAGADHIITMDLHDPQYQGFFDIPVDNLYGKSSLKKYIQTKIPDFKNAVIVSPDAGGAKRATAIADELNVEFALIHKVKVPQILNLRKLMSSRNVVQPVSQTAKMPP